MLLKDDDYTPLEGTGLIAKNPYKEHETIINADIVLWAAKPTNVNNPAQCIIKFQNGTGMDVKQTLEEMADLLEVKPTMLN